MSIGLLLSLVALFIALLELVVPEQYRRWPLVVSVILLCIVNLLGNVSF